MFPILTALSLTISIIVLAITGVFGKGKEEILHQKINGF